MKCIRLIAMLALFSMAQQVATANAQHFPILGFGAGTYAPNATRSGGTYDGWGISTIMGPTVFDGTTQVIGSDPDNPGILFWQNQGQGTDAEILHVNQTWFGKLKMRISGQLELMPTDPSATEFTAIWTGRFEFVGGTGMFRHASGYADVTAVNPPFQLTDPEWEFTWRWNGRISLW